MQDGAAAAMGVAKGIASAPFRRPHGSPGSEFTSTFDPVQVKSKSPANLLRSAEPGAGFR
jgi:hypothetical protein